MMKIKSLFRRGHHAPAVPKHLDSGGLKEAASISSLDSKHHKIAPKEKSSKVFGSKDKLNKQNKKKDNQVRDH